MVSQASLRLAIDARGMKAGARDAVAATGSITTGSRKADKSVAALDRRMDILAKTSAFVRGALLSSFGAIGGALAVKEAVTVIGGFEKSLDTLAAVSGATEGQLAALESTARGLGATTKFSAQEAGDGLLFLARAGFDVDQQIAALPSTLDLAAAAELGLGEAADFASNILSQFGLAAEDTARLTDVLVKTANSANTDVRQLADAMKFAGPAAAAAGKEIEETAAAVGVLSDAGIQGSMAGRSLRQIMVKLAKPTVEAREAVAAMGLTLEDLDPTTQKLSTIFAKLRDEELDLAKAAAIFGSEQASAALVLSNSTKRLDELTVANQNAAGTSREVARAMSDNLVGSLLSLRSAVEEAFIQIGDAGLLGGMTDLVRGITDVVRVLIGMEDALDGNAEKAKRYAEIVKALAGGLGFALMTKVVLGTVAAVKALTVAIAVNPLGLLLVTVSSAVAALIFFRDELVTIKGTTATVGEFVVATFEEIRDRASLVFEAIVFTAQSAWQAITQVTSDGLNFILDLLPGFQDDMTGLFDAPMMSARDFANTTVGFLVGVGNAIIALVANVEKVATAFNALDPSDITGGFGLGEVKNQLAFVGSEIAFDVRRGFEEGMAETDYVGVVGDIVNGVKSEFDRVGTDGFSFDEFFSFDSGGGFGSSIADRVKETQELNAQLKAMKFGADVAKTGLLGLAGVSLSGGGEGGGGSGGLAMEVQDLNGMLEELGETGEEAANKTADAMISVADAIKSTTISAAQGLGDALGDVIFESKDAGEAIEELVKASIRQLFDLLVTQQLVNAATSAFGGGATVTANANGNVFSGGSVVPFANGGIVNGPTLFPMSGGRTGLMGEAGPEAVMPLARGSDGKLGVTEVNSGSRGRPINVSLNVNGVKDSDSFRANERQITARLNAVLKLAQY